MKYRIDFQSSDANHRSGILRLNNIGSQVTLTVERTSFENVPPMYKEFFAVMDLPTLRRLARGIKTFCDCVEEEAKRA